jgi:hypothetical protein
MIRRKGYKNLSDKGLQPHFAEELICLIHSRNNPRSRWVSFLWALTYGLLFKRDFDRHCQGALGLLGRRGFGFDSCSSIKQKETG